MLEIVPFEPEMAEAVARCYSEVAAPAPFCEAVGGGWFAELKKLERQPLAEEQVLVAVAEGEVVGFAHMGLARPATDDWHCKGEPGVIRFLAYRVRERAVGAALLEAAEGWLRERGRPTIVAGHCNFMYPFYHLPFSHISERMAHVPPLFGMAGYEVEESEVFFAWEDFEAPEVERPEVEVEIVGGWQKQVSEFGPGVELRVLREGKRVGVCEIPTLGSDEWRPELKEWCFCTGLHVDDDIQGRGLGKYLLARGLREARERGPRHALISTDWNNHRAYLFYTNFDYRFLDRTFSFRKALKAARRKGTE